MGNKPDDKWTLPLCNECHNEQHREGELTFWYRLGISPVHMCVVLYELKDDLDAMRRACFASRER